jgi:hypothetical protein
MFSVITNIYNKKPKDLPWWNCSQLQENWKSVFLQLEIFDVCITGDMTPTENLYFSKNFFSFPVAMNNSIKVGPLVFLL